MTEVSADAVGETTAPDANVSQTNDSDADAKPVTNGNEADPSPAAKESGNSDVVKPIQSRFDELTREKHYERRRAEAAERRAEAAEARERERERVRPVIAEPSQVKTSADFGYDDLKFQAYLFDEAERRADKRVDERLKERESQEAKIRRRTAFDLNERKFAKTTPDYFESTRNQDVPLTEEIINEASESEKSAEILYYLSKNSELAERLARLPEKALAREIGRIETKLSYESVKAKEKPVVSTAPAPTPKIDASDPVVAKDPSQMTDAEFAKWRRRQIAQRH